MSIPANVSLLVNSFCLFNLLLDTFQSWKVNKFCFVENDACKFVRHLQTLPTIKFCKLHLWSMMNESRVTPVIRDAYLKNSCECNFILFGQYECRWTQFVLKKVLRPCVWALPSLYSCKLSHVGEQKDAIFGVKSQFLEWNSTFWKLTRNSSFSKV